MRLAPLIDHTLLSPLAGQEAIDRLCAEAIEQEFCTVCVAGRWVSRAAYRTAETTVGVTAVVNFPGGNNSPVAVVSEAAASLADGADEIDTLLPLGDFLDRRFTTCVETLRSVTALGAPVKVILETGALTPQQSLDACALAEEAGAAFVKTSTGFGFGGATVEAVRLMHRAVGGRLGVKASGGISTREQAMALVDAGATRLGCSRSLQLIDSEDEEKDDRGLALRPESGNQLVRRES